MNSRYDIDKHLDTVPRDHFEIEMTRPGESTIERPVERAESFDGSIRYHYVLPKSRVVFAGFLAILGFILMITGLAKQSMALGIAGLICFVPGSYASYVYWKISRGEGNFNSETWMRVEEI